MLNVITQKGNQISLSLSLSHSIWLIWILIEIDAIFDSFSLLPIHLVFVWTSTWAITVHLMTCFAGQNEYLLLLLQLSFLKSFMCMCVDCNLVFSLYSIILECIYRVMWGLWAEYELNEIRKIWTFTNCIDLLKFDQFFLLWAINVDSSSSIFVWVIEPK